MPNQNVASIAQPQHRAIFTKVSTSVFRWVHEQRATLLGIYRRTRSKNAQSSTTWKESHEKVCSWRRKRSPHSSRPAL